MKTSGPIALVLFAMAFSISALDTFLNCPGNDDIWGLLRRCCPSEQMPNGCECFDISDKTDFTNTAFHKPECPEDIGVQFHLFTRGSRDTSNIVRADMNVIIVNWQKGAESPNYYQAAANTRSVGAMIAQLVRVMKTRHGLDLNNVHLIGHSLGSHISGSAGKEIRRLESALIGRITGLDPAGPAFESYSSNVRIDVGDASFVDVIHTDGETLLSSGFGTRFSIGHVDFYPNGGEHQPGCPEETMGILSMLDFEAESSKGACSHSRCLDFFTNSIHTCSYLPPNGDDRCVMGYHTSTSCRGDHYPKTSAITPFC